MSAIRRAIVSVSDKRGLVDFVRGLHRRGVDILSTGGTARALAEAGVPTRAISDYTGAPEILDGRVKTLHPKVHGGLLGRDVPEHRRQMAEQGIEPIDLVVVNLYPFEATVARPGVSFEDAIENIDIGGPSMLRSAAKNHERVTVIVDPDDYAPVLAEIEASGEVSAATRGRLARKVFVHTSAYDAAIAAYLGRAEGDPQADFPAVLSGQWALARSLRYGENPHQKAGFYADVRRAAGGGPSLAGAEVLQGKELSYNNLLDLDAALGCCLEFDAPTAVIVKHTNPCGVASAADVAAAYRAARETDPTSAFGGIVAVNREVDGKLATQLAETFLECVIAPSFSDEARAALAGKKNLRLLAAGPMTRRTGGWALRSVAGGLLVQTADVGLVPAAQAKVVSKRAPTAEELAGLDFAWRVAKHVKSNAIVFCRGARTAAVGAGQMSRVDSVKVARFKADEVGTWRRARGATPDSAGTPQRAERDASAGGGAAPTGREGGSELPLEGSVVASDAFFPFRDGVDALAEAGATAVIQPGGSVRDEEVIAAADERGLAMLFTGMRHFRH